MSDDTSQMPHLNPNVADRYRYLAGFLSIEAAALHELLIVCECYEAGQAVVPLIERVTCDIRRLAAMRADLDLVLRDSAGVGIGALDRAWTNGSASTGSECSRAVLRCSARRPECLTMP